ncbi:MAG: VOC family protein [Dysgonamonadaceae bacterium]|jgi:glyoxylase I family protein|nr:VOC family protein [Dysgonamonadaceae bacterium]
MIKLNKVHHIAVICSDYEKSKKFYVDILGFKVEKEFFRQERSSYKLDLSLNGLYTIELFSFPNPPKRLTRPEAAGLRHIAFETDDIEDCVLTLKTKEINVEPLRVDEFTGKKFTFVFDPDNLPIEIYEK